MSERKNTGTATALYGLVPRQPAATAARTRQVKRRRSRQAPRSDAIRQANAQDLGITPLSADDEQRLADKQPLQTRRRISAASTPSTAAIGDGHSGRGC